MEHLSKWKSREWSHSHTFYIFTQNFFDVIKMHQTNIQNNQNKKLRSGPNQNLFGKRNREKHLTHVPLLIGAIKKPWLNKNFKKI